MAWLLVPLALPFGDSQPVRGRRGDRSVTLLAVASAAMSTVLILAAAGARVLYNRRRRPCSPVTLRPDPRQPPGRSACSSLDPPSAIDPGLGDAAPINIYGACGSP